MNQEVEAHHQNDDGFSSINEYTDLDELDFESTSIFDNAQTTKHYWLGKMFMRCAQAHAVLKETPSIEDNTQADAILEQKLRDYSYTRNLHFMQETASASVPSNLRENTHDDFQAFHCALGHMIMRSDRMDCPDLAAIFSILQHPTEDAVNPWNVFSKSREVAMKSSSPGLPSQPVSINYEKKLDNYLATSGGSMKRKNTPGTDRNGQRDWSVRFEIQGREFHGQHHDWEKAAQLAAKKACNYFSSVESDPRYDRRLRRRVMCRFAALPLFRYMIPQGLKEAWIPDLATQCPHSNNRRFLFARGPNMDILELFYSCVVLLSALRLPKPPPKFHDSPHAGWRRFLNDLGYFCDTKTGGKTVVAIGAEQCETRVIFWLACNESTKKPLELLNSILKMLRNAEHYDEAQLTDLQSNILALFVRESYRRVRFYCRNLEAALECTAKLVRNEEERALQTLLKSLWDKNQHDHARLSLKAYAFRGTPQYKLLRLLASEKSPLAVKWSEVRHYVGRLGSWAKSADSFVRMARNSDFQKRLQNFVCRPVPAVDHVKCQIVDPEDEYSDLLARVFPGLDIHLLWQSFQACTATDSAHADVLANLHKNVPQPVLHAEMGVLELFLSRGLDFCGDNYIACSKPPCFCCSLYASKRAEDIQMRPPHGNIYPKWKPPLQMNQGSTRTNGPQHNVMIYMIEQMRSLIYQRLIGGSSGARKGCDSTTDISTTLPSMHMPTSAG